MNDTPPTIAAPAAASSVSADSLVAPLADSMPSVNVPPEAPKYADVVPEKPNVGEPLKDSLHRPFDSAKFHPRKDTKGRWINRTWKAKHAKAPAPSASFIPEDPKPKAPAESSQTSPGEPSKDSPKPSAAVLEIGPDRAALTADVYARAGISGLMALFGDEWQPDDAAEYSGLRDALAAYLRAEQHEEISPKAAAGFAVLIYAGKRLARPKTQTTLAGWKAKLWAWWQGRKIARAVASYPAPSAQANPS